MNLEIVENEDFVICKISPPQERNDRSPLQGGDLGVGKKQEGNASVPLLFFRQNRKIKHT